jgi:hypothetical protein
MLEIHTVGGPDKRFPEGGFGLPPSPSTLSLEAVLSLDKADWTFCSPPAPLFVEIGLDWTDCSPPASLFVEAGFVAGLVSPVSDAPETALVPLPLVGFATAISGSVPGDVGLNISGTEESSPKTSENVEFEELSLEDCSSAESLVVTGVLEGGSSPS